MRSYCGEVDIVCKKSNQIVFVEVKYRSSDRSLSISPLSYKQIRRIKNTATLYIANNIKYANCEVRFDLFIVRPWSLPEVIEFSYT